MKNIKAKALLTSQDHVKIYFMTVRSNPALIILIASMVLLLPLGILMFDTRTIGFSSLLIFLPLLIFFQFFILAPMSIKKQYKKSKKLNQDIEWLITENYIQLSTADAAEKWNWDEFKKFRIGAGYTLLFLKSNAMIAKAVPHRAFSKDSDRELFHKLVSSKKK
jgi:hypothetical protein